MMNTPFPSDDRSINAEKVLYILSRKKEATADEIATEIMELQGIASEDGVMDAETEVKDLLHQLAEAGKIIRQPESGKEPRFLLAEPKS